MPLVKSGQDRVGNQYSKAAYSLFPRYRLDEAIGIEVERITGDEFRLLEEARKLLLEAGRRALSSLFQEFQKAPKHALHSLTNGRRSIPTSVALTPSSLLKSSLSLIAAFSQIPRASRYGRS
jgi:hypothetical protein